MVNILRRFQRSGNSCIIGHKIVIQLLKRKCHLPTEGVATQLCGNHSKLHPILSKICGFPIKTGANGATSLLKRHCKKSCQGLKPSFKISTSRKNHLCIKDVPETAAINKFNGGLWLRQFAITPSVNERVTFPFSLVNKLNQTNKRKKLANINKSNLIQDSQNGAKLRVRRGFRHVVDVFWFYPRPFRHSYSSGIRESVRKSTWKRLQNAIIFSRAQITEKISSTKNSSHDLCESRNFPIVFPPNKFKKTKLFSKIRSKINQPPSSKNPEFLCQMQDISFDEYVKLTTDFVSNIFHKFFCFVCSLMDQCYYKIMNLAGRVCSLLLRFFVKTHRIIVVTSAMIFLYHLTMNYILH